MNTTLSQTQTQHKLASRSRRKRIDFSSYLLLFTLLALLAVMFMPLVIILINSFKTEPEYYAGGPFSLPVAFNMTSIQQTWALMNYGSAFMNSFFISFVTAILAISISLFNAFALGIGRVKWRTALLIFFILAIMLPQEALAYPLYYLFRQVGLYNNRWAVILIFVALHSAYGTYLLTSIFNAFPRELLEAAELDGCGKLRLLFQMIVPLSLPALSVLFVFFFIWTWNEFFLPLIFLVSESNQTIPLAMALTRGQRGITIPMQSASALLGIVPAVLFFFIFQRTLTKGIMLGSVK